MEPSASNCISIDEQSEILQKKSSPPSQQIVGESMENLQANDAGPIHLDTRMELEHSLYQMEPSASNCISIDEQSEFLQKKSSPPSQQIVDESMENLQANDAGPVDLDTQMELERSLYQMEPSASNCISFVEQSEFLQKILCSPSQMADESMEDLLAIDARPVQLDTQMELEHCGPSQILLDLFSPQITGDTQIEFESSKITLGLPSPHCETIDISHINDPKAPCILEAENETDTTKEEQDKTKMEPSASNCISIDELSGLHKRSSLPPQQMADESMLKPQANATLKLGTQMKLEHSGSPHVILDPPSLPKAGDAQMEVEHLRSSQMVLGLSSPQKAVETIKISRIADCKAPCYPIKEEAEDEINTMEEIDKVTTEEQDEPYFLTDKPYFHRILGKTQVDRNNMAIPKSVNQLLPAAEVPVILSYQNKTWSMKYYGNRGTKKFNPSWKYFVKDNKLKVGDACVFELTEHNSNCIKFRIQILDGDIPSEFLDRVDGESKDYPIVIDV